MYALNEKITFSILTTTNTKQCKTLSIDSSGAVVKSSMANATSGAFTVHTVESIQAFADALNNFTPKQSLILGTPHRHDGTALQQGEKIALTIKAKPLPHAIPRSKDFIKNTNNAGFALFDIDEGGSHEQLSAFIPELEGKGALIRPSSASFIYDSAGNELIGAKGLHIFIPIQNVSDSERIADILWGRQWLAGNGHYLLSAGINPMLLERGIYDKAVLGACERLAFEAKPILNDGLIQKAIENQQVIEGGILDTSIIQDLTPEQWAEVERLKQQAKELVKPAHNQAIKAAKRAYIANSNKPVKVALAEYKHLSSGILPHDFEVLTIDGLKLVSNLTAKHDGLTMCEPLDRGYDGGSLTKAKFFFNNGNPKINSQAHGGIVYSIADSFALATIEKGSDFAIYNALITAKEKKNDCVVIGEQVFFLSKSENFNELCKEYKDQSFSVTQLIKPLAYLLKLIELAPTCHLNRLGNRLAFLVSNDVPRYYSVMAAADFVYSTLATRGNTGAKVKALAIITNQVKKRIQAVKIRNKITNKQGIIRANFLNLDCDENEKNKLIAKVIVNHGMGKIWLDNRGLGAGKTKLLEQLRRLLSEHSIAYVCHRVSLTKDAARRLGVTSYHDADPAFFEQFIAMCVNSITKFRLANYQVLFIDEFKQTLEHILNGTVDNRAECLATLIEAIKNADLVVCSDADLNNDCVSFLKKHCGGKSINLIETTPNPNKKTIHILPSHKATYQAIADEIRGGGYPFIACTSKNEAVKLYAFLSEQGLTDGLLIHAKNRGEVSQAEFLASPNDALFNESTGEDDLYTFIIHSPTIGSGVSIEKRHFTNNYFLHAGNLASNEALQMTARNRCANDIFVSFSEQKFFNRAVDDLELLEQGEKNKAARLPDLFTAKRGGGYEFKELTTLRIKSKRAINDDKNDFANNFLLLAELNGYAINYDRVNDAPEVDTKGLAKRVKEIIVNDIFTADIIDKTTADRLEAKQAPTQTDSDQLDRFKTTVMTGIDEIASDDVKNFVSGAMKQLINHETAHASLTECKQFDIKNSITENKSTSKVSIHELFNLTIKPILDDGIVIDQVTAAALCELLKGNAPELVANDLGNYTAKTFKQPVNVLRNFIKLYGYELELVSRSKQGVRTYKIIAIEHIERYAEQRKRH